MKKIMTCVFASLICIACVSSFLLDITASVLEDELKTAVGEQNSESMFDLTIAAPEKYHAGEEIVIRVSVNNIIVEDGIDYIGFDFFYDQSKLILTNDIDEGDNGILVCIDTDTLGNDWSNFSTVSSNYSELTPEQLRNGEQAVPANDGCINAQAFTTGNNSVYEDEIIVFEFTFTAKDDVNDDVGVYITNTSIIGGINVGSGLSKFKGNGEYSIIAFDDTPFVDESSDISSTESTSSDDNSSENNSSEDTSSDSTSEDTSSEEENDETIESPIKEELESAVGEANADSKFNLVIDAPESYRAGDEIAITVTVKNITAEFGIDHLKFIFKYDNTKLFLTNDLDENEHGNLVCIDLEPLGKTWSSICLTSNSYKDMTEEEQLTGAPAVVYNDGIIDISVFTESLYTNSVKDDDELVFYFTFKVFDDTTGDIGVYIPNSTVMGALNQNYGLDYFKGNAGYSIIVENTSEEEPIIPTEKIQVDVNGLILTLSDDETYFSVTDYIGTAAEVVIPSEYDNIPVKIITSDAFNNCEFITGIAIPKTVATIEPNSFDGCTNMCDIYCYINSRPDTWDEQWNANCESNIHWGYTLTDAENELIGLIQRYDALVKSDYCDIEWNNISNKIESAKQYSVDNNTIFEYVRMINEVSNIFIENPAIDEFGDVNDDNTVDAIDYVLIKRSCYNTYTLDAIQNARADIDRSDEINSSDYILIKRIVFKTYTIK